LVLAFSLLPACLGFTTSAFFRSLFN
jgi:hypothetical protein